jgi:hypothetical protein
MGAHEDVQPNRISDSRQLWRVFQLLKSFAINHLYLIARIIASHCHFIAFIARSHRLEKQQFKNAAFDERSNLRA